jgi:chromosomal replication initiator protein
VTVTLNPLYRFDTFVVGAGNRLAVTASKAVAESPGTVYNPLFIYARPGLGKTHLLMGLGHAARAINSRLVVEYLTLDEFVEAFHAAIAAGQGAAYRQRFLDVDLLLVDDVQFLTHRREMQAELLRLTDALQAANRQIVLTSDRPPAEIEALDDRLIRRFAGGLVIDVAAPDYETRVAILRRKAEERRASFADGVLDAVAALEIDNVRELLGALNRLIAFQSVSDAPLTAGQARQLVGGETQRTQMTQKTQTSAGADGQLPSSSPSSASSASSASLSEFEDFLSEITATVTEQVDAWRTKVGAAILRWEGEGFRTSRLEALLEREMITDPERVIRAFEADVVRLAEMQAEAAALVPDLAGSPLFKDPGDMAAAEVALQRAREGAHPPPAPSPLWKLDEMVESGGNRMALEAARTVCAAPGVKYNPLVIVGAGGTGKTHLLHAIGNALAETGGPVACLSAPEFTSELIEAINRDAVPAWRACYRRATAFLLDDVHLVAETDRTQDELFLLFNQFAESGRQMVFTSGAPLASLEGLEARLRTRLEGGLVVELPAPDADVRERVIARDLTARLGASDQALATYLASRPAESVRAAQGLVQRVLATAEERQIPPTAALAREILEGLAPAEGAPPKRAPVRSSGIVAPSASGARSREKMIWEWPEVGDRLVEDWR